MHALPCPRRGPAACRSWGLNSAVGRRRRRCQDGGNGATVASCRVYFISAPRVQDVRGIRRHSQIGNCAFPQRASSGAGCSPKSTCPKHNSPPKPSRNEHINHWKLPIFTFRAELWAVSLGYLVITTLSTLLHLHAPKTVGRTEKVAQDEVSL